jgi:hypothetical protein
LLGLAALILQRLPVAESGIQFIPLLPWAYSGLLPIWVSGLCWGGIFVAGVVAISGCPHEQAAMCV